MYSIANYEYDCTKTCKNREHANLINSAITKRMISDEELAAFIGKTCRNFVDNPDELGRSSLAMCCSVNRCKIAEWLIKLKANIALKDKESGHTPLHRAIYYGCVSIAVLLLKCGASLDVMDEDFLNPLQLICKLNRPIDPTMGYELFVWGKNKNYNLGIGNVQGRPHPEYLEFFRKQMIFVQTVSLNYYHSLFLTASGDVYCTGHGKGGRLGNGSENTLVTPTLIEVTKKYAEEKIISISTSRYHSLLLSDHNIVYSSGINNCAQLGFKPPIETVTTFKEINGLQALNGKKLTKVFAKDYYSAVVSATDVFVWGLNGGQFGMKENNETILYPKQLPIPNEKSTIELFDCSEAAIACYTGSRNFYIFNKFKVKSYKDPLKEQFEKIVVTGGEFQHKNEIVKNHKENNSLLKILILTVSHDIYIWYEDIQQFVKCLQPISHRHIAVDQIKWCNEKLLVLYQGHVYLAKVHNKFDVETVKSSSDYHDTYAKKELCATNRFKIDYKRMPYITNAVDVFSDAEGENFAVLQEYTKQHYRPPFVIFKNHDFEMLLMEANEFDNIHDIVFYVEDQPFPAHKFLIYARCPYLRQLVEEAANKNVVVKYTGLSGKFFELILRYIYTNRLISKDELDELIKISNQKAIDILSKLKKILVLFELTELADTLKKPEEHKKSQYPVFHRIDYPDTYDVTIKLEEDKEIKCHKCVIASRLEYFNMMFIHTWSEKNLVNLTTIPYEYMAPIIDFLYDNNPAFIKSQKYNDTFLYNMIAVCDQFFVDELKKVYEQIISEKISIKNIGEVLEFAFSYNCQLLQNQCMQFVALNLAKVLEQHLLDQLDTDMLAQVNKFYRNFYNIDEYRVITPYSDAIDDEALQKFIKDFRVDLNTSKESESNDGTAISKGKLKVKISKQMQAKRNYEKEGIMLIQSLSIEEQNVDRKSDTKMTAIKDEAKNISNKLKLESVHWTKVVDKKEKEKKKLTVGVTAGLKSNEILQSESKVNDKFTKLSTSNNNGFESLTPEKAPETPIVVAGSPSTPAWHLAKPEVERMVVCLGDFAWTSQKSKGSGKQRKRQSSETQPTPIVADGSTPKEEKTNGNPWTTNNNTLASLIKSPTESRRSDSINIPQRAANTPSKTSPSMSSSFGKNSFNLNNSFGSPKPGASMSFSEILEDEIREKQYVEKIKSKSLILTQMEETAIEELKQFYNVDEVFDENIKIERKQGHKGLVNYAIWQIN